MAAIMSPDDMLERSRMHPNPAFQGHFSGLEPCSAQNEVPLGWRRAAQQNTVTSQLTRNCRWRYTLSEVSAQRRQMDLPC